MVPRVGRDTLTALSKVRIPRTVECREMAIAAVGSTKGHNTKQGRQTTLPFSDPCFMSELRMRRASQSFLGCSRASWPSPFHEDRLYVTPTRSPIRGISIVLKICYRKPRGPLQQGTMPNSKSNFYGVVVSSILKRPGVSSAYMLCISRGAPSPEDAHGDRSGFKANSRKLYNTNVNGS
jgi:hypothetical protein